MMDKDCTFGASVTAWSNLASGNSSPTAFSAPTSRVSNLVSKFEGTTKSNGAMTDVRASVNSYQRFSPLSSRSGSLSSNSVSSTEATKGFYCKSAPAYSGVFIN
jgi:hypothetical protein